MKGSARMAVVLHRLLWDRLKLDGDPELEQLVAAVRERTFSYEAGRERFRERLAGMLAARALDARSLVSEEEAISAVRKTREYQKLATRAWPRETPEGLVEKLYKNRARLERVAGDLLDDDEIALLLRSSAAVKRRDMTPTDVALLDEAHWLIDPGFRRFGHVVVDEAQNLTPMELRMTVRRARGQSLTILGDLSQRTADAGVSSWDRVLDEAGVDEHAVSELTVSYRVPNEFLEIAARAAPAGRTGAARRPRGAVPAGGRAQRDVGPAAAREAARLRDVGSVGSSRRERASTTCAARWPESSTPTRSMPRWARASTCSTFTWRRAWSSTRSSSSSPRRSSPNGPTAGSVASIPRSRGRLGRSRLCMPSHFRISCGQFLTAMGRRVPDMDFKLELVAIPVSDVDRAKAFYEQAGFNADHDHKVSEDMRFVQLTPPGSACSIAIGKGVTDAEPGSVKGMQVVVDDIEAARAELVERGIDVSEIQRFPWGASRLLPGPGRERLGRSGHQGRIVIRPLPVAAL